MEKIAYVAQAQNVKIDSHGDIIAWGDSFDIGAFDTYHEAETSLRRAANALSQYDYDRTEFTIAGYVVPLESDVCDYVDYFDDEFGFRDPCLAVGYDLKREGDIAPVVSVNFRDLYEHSIFTFDAAWFDEQAREGK